MSEFSAFDLSTAIALGRTGQIEEWVHTYLNAGDWANPGLSNGLKLQQRWWIGPIEMDLSQLVRCVGPEPGMEYPVDAQHWEELTGKMAESMTDPLRVPPLIAEYRSGELSVRDGNTRHGAFARKGWSTAWVIIWYNRETDYLTHRAHLIETNHLDSSHPWLERLG
jgi:hypothetical protein